MKKIIESKKSIFKIPSLLLVFFLSIAILYSCEDEKETNKDKSDISVTTNSSSAGSEETPGYRTEKDDDEDLYDEPGREGGGENTRKNKKRSERDKEDDTEDEEEESDFEEDTTECEVALSCDIIIPKDKAVQINKSFQDTLLRGMSKYTLGRGTAKRAVERTVQYEAKNISRYKSEYKEYDRGVNKIGSNNIPVTDRFGLKFRVNNVDEIDCENTQVSLLSVVLEKPEDGIFTLTDQDYRFGYNDSVTGQTEPGVDEVSIDLISTKIMKEGRDEGIICVREMNEEHIRSYSKEQLKCIITDESTINLVLHIEKTKEGKQTLLESLPDGSINNKKGKKGKKGTNIKGILKSSVSALKKTRYRVGAKKDDLKKNIDKYLIPSLPYLMEEYRLTVYYKIGENDDVKQETFTIRLDGFEKVENGYVFKTSSSKEKKSKGKKKKKNK